MALTISMAKSSTVEPVRRNRWIMLFEAIPGGAATLTEDLAFAAKTVTLPNKTYTEGSTQRLNEWFYSAGKIQWNQITATFYDYIEQNSAAQILDTWASEIYNPLTGQMKYKSQYTTNGTIAQLDPLGVVFRSWNLFHVWPMTVTFGENLSSEDDTISEISATFRYDYAIKTADTGPNDQ